MSGSELPKIIALGINEIVVGERLRIASPSGVDSLVESIREIGKIMQPLTVQKVKKEYRLIDGLNRLEAARIMGLTEVPVAVEHCTNAEALRMEVDANTAGAPLNALDMAVFLAARKELYEKEHPEKKQGISGAKARWDASDILAIASFVDNAAVIFGKSKRTIYRLISLGERLPAEGVAYLRQSKQQVRFDDLQEIAKLGDPEEMTAICKALSDGTAKSAKEVMNRKKAPGTLKKDKVEADYQKISDAFSRASKAARKRFVGEWRDDLVALLADLPDVQDEPAEVIPFSTRREG